MKKNFKNDEKKCCSSNQECGCDSESCCCGEECNCKNEKCDCSDGCCCGEECNCNSDSKCSSECKCDNEIKDDYQNQIKLANDKINELTLEIINLKQELLKSQDEYKKRLEEKSAEANAKVAEKRQELENRLNEEIEIKKHKLISNDMQQLFATIDQFENVINSPCNDPQVAAYVSGFKMLLTLFEQSLNNLGITRIIVNKGDKFNADIMSAIDAIETNEVKSGLVVKVQSPAYIYNEKVVKHAIVVVSK